MAHYALIENDTVIKVIVAEDDFIQAQSGEWVQTSYNTRAGIHYGPDDLPSGQPALRANYAGIGFGYNRQYDAFHPAAPYRSELYDLDTTTFMWSVKTEYGRIVPAVSISALFDLPGGEPGNQITVGGVSLSDGQQILFNQLSIDSGVYSYDITTGNFVNVSTVGATVVVDNEQSVFQLVGGSWLSIEP
jgi:hypothetical protein